jgi:uncharacterized membrane protein YcjF (UPF0283 family)
MIVVAGLDDTIGNFGSLVGLILALITLFTGARDTSVRSLEEGPLTAEKKGHLRAESRLSWWLFGATLLLLFAGGPLWIRTLTHWSWSTDHSIRWGFIIVWLLLVPLGLWQINIARRAREKADTT